MSSKPIIESVNAITQGFAEEGNLFVFTLKKKGGHLVRNFPNKKINEGKKNR